MTGQTVSHYRILEQIGSGGMGEVYLAEDTKLERKVALKFLPQRLMADDEARERFKREAKSAAALNHPNIVTIHEIGEHEGQVFIAMEYVDGHTLKELISSDRPPSTVHRLPISQVIDIAAQIASGLSAAHAKGIVHRDIKPQNVVIDRNGRVKILDFGLAKLKGASPLSKESFTYGTVHYMSPEQGLGREVDARSDIWSLGAVLYEMLAGAPPFRGEYEQAVIYAIVNEPTPPLPDQARRESPGLEAVIGRCLAKKPQDRFPTAAALTTAIEELGTSGQGKRPAGRGGRRMTRRRLLAAASALVAVALLVLIASSPWAAGTLKRLLAPVAVPQARHLAVLPIAAGGDEEARALGDGLTAVIIDKLTWLERFHDSMWTVPAGEVFTNRAKPARDLHRLWGCNLFVGGELQAETGSLRLALYLQDAHSGRRLKRIELRGSMANLSVFQEGLLNGILKLFELPAREDMERFVNFGGTSLPGAYILYLKGRGALMDDRDVNAADRGIELLEKALQQDDGYVLARLALAAGLRAKSKRTRHPELLAKVEAIVLPARKAAGSWPPAWLAWGLLQNDMGRKPEAEAAFQAALKADDRCYAACIELAWGAMNAGKAGAAERFFKRAVQLRRGYPTALSYLAYFYSLNGRNEEAIACYREITRLAPGDSRAFSNLGGLYLMKGDRPDALAMFEKANAIQPDAVIQSNLATLYFYEGRYRQALPLFLDAVGKSSDHLLWGNLADTYRQLPECRAQARDAYQKAIRLAEAAQARDPESADTASALALYYAYTGDPDRSRQALARARTLAPGDLEVIRRSVLAHEAVGDRAQALAALREYRERLGPLEQVEKEPDLAPLLHDPAYAEIAGRKTKP